MDITTHRVAYFIQADHNDPLQSMQKNLCLKFDKLVLVSEDEEFIARAKSFFKSGEIIEVVPLRTAIPIGAVIIPTDNKKPELKIIHGDQERTYSAEEIQKLLNARVIVDNGNGYYEIAPGKSWEHIDEVLKPKKRHKP